MLRAILNESWRQHPTKHQLYSHLPPITKTIQVRWTRLTGHCWRSREELISDVLLWTPTYGRAKAGWPARTYIQQLCEDTGCSLEDLQAARHDDDDVVSSNHFYIMIIIYLHIVIWFQVFLSYTNNLFPIWFQVFLSYTNNLFPIWFQVNISIW